MTLKDKILSEMVHTDAEIEEIKGENIKQLEIKNERFKKLKSGFLKELRKTAYPRLKRVYGGKIYVKYLTSSPDFNQAFQNLIINIEKEVSQMKAEPTKDEETAIAEFKENILKSTGLPDWGSLSWYNQVEQAARNLFEKGVEKGHQEGWDDCLEEHYEELLQLQHIDEILSKRDALENIPNRIDKILFMLSELEKSKR